MGEPVSFGAWGFLAALKFEPRAELAEVRDRINELANQMAGVPFDADIFTFRRVEKPLPHRGLAENVVVHNRQVIRALGTMLEGDAHPFVSGEVCQRLPKRQY